MELKRKEFKVGKSMACVLCCKFLGLVSREVDVVRSSFVPCISTRHVFYFDSFSSHPFPPLNIPFRPAQMKRRSVWAIALTASHHLPFSQATESSNSPVENSPAFEDVQQTQKAVLLICYI